jgi:hypothetical protein
LKEASPCFAAGTIGRRYDGVLGLAGTVKEVKVSSQLSGDNLSDLPLIRI